MAAFPPYTTTLERIWFYTFRTLCGLVFFFLIAPLVVIVPLSFNQVPYFTFTPEMLSLDPAGYSTRWYKDFFTNLNWQGAVKNSVIIAFFATILATVLGTVAALGLSRAHMPFRTTVMGLLISPMIVPLIISAAGMYFFYSKVGLQGSFLGVILAHTALGTPSFDEVVVILFVASYEQRTIPWQMFSGIREQISPTILAVATILICVSVLILIATEMLRRRGERLRGVTPA